MRVSELTGELLDAWVAKAEGVDGKVQHGYPNFEITPFSPSIYWSHGGPIIERERISVEPNPYGLDEWAACHGPHEQEPMWVWKNGPTPLIAAMRCLVASKYGETVDDVLTE